MSSTEFLISEIIFKNYKGVNKVRSTSNKLTNCFETTIYFKSGFRKEIKATFREIRAIEGLLCYENYKKELEIFIKQKIDEAYFIKN